jgi:hypothetical protein
MHSIYTVGLTKNSTLKNMLFGSAKNHSFLCALRCESTGATLPASAGRSKVFVFRPFQNRSRLPFDCFKDFYLLEDNLVESIIH